ncbi:hypothetical protein ACOMHN_011363 [Nucella lapillus]
MELGILHNSQPSTKRGCRAGRLHRLWHGLPPAPWPCTRSQHHSVPSRNLHPLMVPPFLQPHPDLQSAVGNAPLSSKHPAQLPTTDCLLSIISPMGGQPSDAPALSPPSPLQQGGQSSNAPALSPPSPLPQGGQPIALALSPPSPPPQGGQPSDAPGLSPSSSTLLLCPSDSTLNICHLNSQSAVKTDLDREITDSKCFVPVSAAVSADGKWQPLVNFLDIKPLTVRQLQNNYRHDTRELTLQLLVRWQRSTAPQATVRQLVKVLCESKNYEAVEALSRYFSE